MNETRQCSKCKEDRPVSLFQHFNGKPSGQCRVCKTEAMRALNRSRGAKPLNATEIRSGEKKCAVCKTFKPTSAFSPAARGRGGLSSRCKACQPRVGKKEATIATASYRKRHRERHLANHRLRMWERNSKKKVTDDGTVTDAFLRGIYGTEKCHYCGYETPREKRTADHKIPLARDGKHSASNIVMACCGCNSSKRDMTDVEFLERIKRT